MFNLRDNSSPAERYNAVFDTALKGVIQRHGTIRNNSFASKGELANTLARLGAPVVDLMISNDTAGEYMVLDVSREYVNFGGYIALDFLERVIHPSNSSYGPGNFNVMPCDSTGSDLKEVKIPDELDERTSDIISRQSYWLGMDRVEIFRVAAIGIGLAMAKEDITLKRSMKAATKEAESDRWYNHAQNAISFAAEMALTAVQHQDTGNSSRSAYVRIEPMAGQGAEASAETPIEITSFTL